MDRDGPQQGYDIDGISEISNDLDIPIIASGGVGKFEHFIDGINLTNVDAVSTANLFYFMSDALSEARKVLIDEGINMAKC